jgi:hypothetical protein
MKVYFVIAKLRGRTIFLPTGYLFCSLQGPTDLVGMQPWMTKITSNLLERASFPALCEHIASRPALPDQTH